MSYQSMVKRYMKNAEKDGISVGKGGIPAIGDAAERGVTEEDSWERMKGMWQAMQDSLDAYDPELMSRSRLVGKRRRSDGPLPGTERIRCEEPIWRR